jgi:glc operon protein GlcG
MRSKPVLEPADVAKMVAAAKAEAAKHGWEVAIAVVTEGGYIAHVERLGNFEGMNGEIAVAKARGAALTKRTSKEWEDRLKERIGFLNFPNVLPIQGGLPIEYDGHCVGGIGVSGRPSHEDEIVARAALAALTSD